MRIPGWILYTAVLAAIVATLFVAQGADGRMEFMGRKAAPAPIITELKRDDLGPSLPDPDLFDERVLVNVADPESGAGTAFAVNRSGLWLTARHVVDGCSRVGLAVGGGRHILVNEWKTSPTSDLALLVTDRAPHALQVNLAGDLHVGQTAYHVGFPHGRAGEAASTLKSRSQLVTRGRYKLDEPVLAFDETQRSIPAEDSLAGMSGGPVFDATGAVVGMTVAEAPRRGRIYAAGPDTIGRFLDEQGVQLPEDAEAHPINGEHYSREADRLRSAFAVVKVVCQVGD